MEFKIIGTDYFPHSVGLYWVDKGYLLPDVLRPEVNEEDWLGALIKIINQEKIDILLPGLDFEIPILTRLKKESPIIESLKPKLMQDLHFLSDVNIVEAA